MHTVFSLEQFLVQVKNKVSDKRRLLKVWATVETEIEIIQKLQHEFRRRFLKILAILFHRLAMAGLTETVLSL